MDDLKKHSKFKFWVDVFLELEGGTVAFIFLFIYVSVCVVVSCFVKSFSDIFLMNLLYVMFWGFVYIFCILFCLFLVCGFLCLVWSSVEDIILAYQTILDEYKESKQSDVEKENGKED